MKEKRWLPYQCDPFGPDSSRLAEWVVHYQYYPTNLNIRAKIRQQLQTLPSMGLVEHVVTGRWRKL